MRGTLGVEFEIVGLELVGDLVDEIIWGLFELRELFKGCLLG